MFPFYLLWLLSWPLFPFSLFYLTHILCVSGFGFTIAITLKYPIHFHNVKYKIYLSELKTYILVIHIEHPTHVPIFFINSFYLSNKSQKINMYSLNSYSLATHFPSSWAVLINKLPFPTLQILLTTSMTSGSLSVWSVSFTPVHSLYHFSRLWHYHVYPSAEQNALCWSLCDFLFLLMPIFRHLSLLKS